MTTDLQQRIADLEQQRDTYLEQRVQAEAVIAALQTEIADLRMQLATQNAALTAIAVRQYQGGQA